ncbi:MAG TPA: hypothetical protein VFE47_30990 [Tepidisphaeraceae bacterium]|jgi:hypothetical protein|nr:hypothetical protein [Tepidisphaeraceae bacterium]
MEKLGLLLERMENGSPILHLMLKEEEVVAAVDERDDRSFADQWMSLFRQVEIIKGGRRDADPRVGRLRELAYLQAFERWRSSDLAAMISDDFGLIGDALAVGFEDESIKKILEQYLALKFPRRIA